MNTNKKTVLLSDVVSVENFVREIAADRIQERVHPDDSDLRIYSYTKKTQFGGLWTPESRLARGLILRVPEGDFTKATVESRGLPKFFTVSQVESDWGRVKLIDDDENVVVDEAPEIPWDMPAVVADKMNGALGLGYIDSSGRFRVSTKGSFVSLEAEVANRILDSKYAKATDFFSRCESVAPSFTTMLFEIITPERLHPVDYGNLEDLIFLGTIDNRTGQWTPAVGDEDIVLAGFPFAPTRQVKSLREAVALPYEDNTEGFVVTVLGGGPDAIYKVKPNEYLMLRRLFYALQDTELSELINSKDFSNRLHDMDSPEKIDLSDLVGDIVLNGQIKRMFDNRRQAIFDEVVAPARKIVAEVMNDLESVEGIRTMNRGEVARYIKANHSDKTSLYFAGYDDLIDGPRDDGSYRCSAPAVKQIVAN